MKPLGIEYKSGIYFYRCECGRIIQSKSKAGVNLRCDRCKAADQKNQIRKEILTREKISYKNGRKDEANEIKSRVRQMYEFQRENESYLAAGLALALEIIGKVAE